MVCAQFELEDREQHIVKYVVFVRSLSWWRFQPEFNLIISPNTQFLHLSTFGGARRWESQFSAAWLNALSRDEAEP